MQPTVAGFLTFIRTVMGISSTILPDDDPVIPYAFEVARALVNPALACVTSPSIDGPPSISIYNLAVYNLAGSNLLSYAQDQPGAPNVKGSKPPAPYFQNLRKVWNINGFVPGVIQSSSDEATSMSLVVLEAAKNFTLSNLQNMKNPYGRQYEAFSQDYGSIWGIS